MVLAAAYAQPMRRFILVLALIAGFAIVSERGGAAQIRVFATGALTGVTLGVGGAVASAMLNRGEAEQLAADRMAFSDIDWLGRLSGFAVIAWLAWQRFGRRPDAR